MSFFRIALIPLYLWLYCVQKAVIPAICVLALSGLTDIFDGIVARKFNMVSDFGKFIDPVADKLTQGALILSLSVNFPDIWPLFFIFLIPYLYTRAREVRSRSIAQPPLPSSPSPLNHYPCIDHLPRVQDRSK